jgi:hypothetical protein
LCHFLSLQDLSLFCNYACVLYAGFVIGCGGTNLNIWFLFAWVCMLLSFYHFKTSCFWWMLFPKNCLQFAQDHVWLILVVASGQSIIYGFRNTCMVQDKFWGLSTISKSYAPLHFLKRT